MLPTAGRIRGFHFLCDQRAQKTRAGSHPARVWHTRLPGASILSYLSVKAKNTCCNPSVDRIINLCPAAAVSLSETTGCIDIRSVRKGINHCISLAGTGSHCRVLACARIDGSFYSADYLIKSFIVDFVDFVTHSFISFWFAVRRGAALIDIYGSYSNVNGCFGICHATILIVYTWGPEKSTSKGDGSRYSFLHKNE